MPLFCQKSVAKLRQFVWIAATVLVFCHGTRAFADEEGWQLIFPEFGLGGGGLSIGEESGPIFQFDINGGASRPLGVGEAGLMLRLDFLFNNPEDPARVFRFDIAPLVTYAFKADVLRKTAGQFQPTLRFGAGPLWTFLQVNGQPGGAGVGLSGEISAGFEGMIDVYANVKSSTDSFGPSLSSTFGLRLNALLVLWILAEAG